MLLNLTNMICAKENDAMPEWVRSSFPVIKIVIVAIIALLAIAMIVLVVLQKGESNGVSAITGQSDTFYNRNKGATLQGKIKVITIVISIVILVLCIAYLILNKIYEPFI